MFKKMTTEEAEQYVGNFAAFLEICGNSMDESVVNYRIQEFANTLPAIPGNLIKKYRIENLAQIFLNDPLVESSCANLFDRLNDIKKRDDLRNEMDGIIDQSNDSALWNIDRNADVISGMIMKIEHIIANEHSKCPNSRQTQKRSLEDHLASLELKIYQHGEDMKVLNMNPACAKNLMEKTNAIQIAWNRVGEMAHRKMAELERSEFFENYALVRDWVRQKTWMIERKDPAKNFADAQKCLSNLRHLKNEIDKKGVVMMSLFSNGESLIKKGVLDSSLLEDLKAVLNDFHQHLQYEWKKCEHMYKNEQFLNRKDNEPRLENENSHPACASDHMDYRLEQSNTFGIDSLDATQKKSANQQQSNLDQPLLSESKCRGTSEVCGKKDIMLKSNSIAQSSHIDGSENSTKSLGDDYHMNHPVTVSKQVSLHEQHYNQEPTENRKRKIADSD